MRLTPAEVADAVFGVESRDAPMPVGSTQLWSPETPDFEIVLPFEGMYVPASLLATMMGQDA